MQHHDPFSTDIADLTRLEREARRQRAAYTRHLLSVAFHAIAHLFTARRVVG